MPEEPSKYAENQFESSTRNNFPLMGESLTYTKPRVAAAALIHPEFVPWNNLLISLTAAWSGGETVLANDEANQIGATLAFEDKLASLTRKPDADTNSPIEIWDNIIRSQVAYNGPTYLALLPHGRETLTDGSYEARLDAIRDFGVRLSQQSSKPALIALGLTVTAFHTAASGLRDAQNSRKAAVETARVNLEGVRLLAAAALYGMVGCAMGVWGATPLMVDSIWSVALLRRPAQIVPGAPIDTTWAPAIRTLSTTAMPEGATRLEVWRQGPGGTPELLQVGEPGELSVQIPAGITFDPGDMYQLWLQARNSKGTSAPGPKQSWTAV